MRINECDLVPTGGAVSRAGGDADPAASDGRDNSLLLVMPLPVSHDEEGRLLVEGQAANGLDRWAEHFSRVTAACVLIPEDRLRARSSIVWRRVEDLDHADRIEVVPLPWACKIGLFFKHYGPTRAWLRSLIRRSTYLVFGIHYLHGDWASIGCLEAIRSRRPYAVWTDLVDHQVIRWSAEGRSLPRRLYRKHVLSNIVKNYHHYLISHSKVGLFHGRDCFQAYSPYCRNSHIVHDIHVKKPDAIAPERLRDKVAEARTCRRLRIGYAGRADASKGTSDWIRVVEGLRDRGIEVEATWLGDGPDLAPMREAVEALGLGDRIDLPGFVSDRAKVLEFLKGLHAVVFCHKTLESPRILVESLVCGTPIVGYDSPYPSDLIGDLECGRLTPRDDVPALVDALAGLEADRDELARMILATAATIEFHNDDAVFRHRSELIKEHLATE